MQARAVLCLRVPHLLAMAELKHLWSVANLLAGQQQQLGRTLTSRSLDTAGGVTISRPGITVQSAPGAWAVVASPTNAPNIANVIQLRPGANHGTIRDLEVGAALAQAAARAAHAKLE